MKSLLAIGLVALVNGGWAAPANLPLNALRSVSGQFVVHDRRSAASAFNRERKAQPSELELEPSFLVVSCERIKEALAVELATDRDWKGSIQVSLHSGHRNGNVPKINVERFGAGWVYQVELSQWIEQDQFIRTIVQVLLIELANRTPATHSAEIPLWLSEGLTQRLLASHAVELVLSAPTVSVGMMMVQPSNIETRDPDPLARARQILRARPPPTLDELSWPAVAKFSPDDAEFFQVSAQLFVDQLLKLENGKEKLQKLVAMLPLCYNWQTAFLQVYSPEFPNQLALEKWWALQAAHFVGRDNKQLWTPAESAQKLDEILHASVAVRTIATELPARTDIPLQTVIREWDTVRQLMTVQEKLRALNQACFRVAPAYISLVNDYQAVLAEFLQKRSRSSATFGGPRAVPPSMRQVARETVAKLDALDTRRQQLTLPNSAGQPPKTRSIPTQK